MDILGTRRLKATQKEYNFSNLPLLNSFSISAVSGYLIALGISSEQPWGGQFG